MQAIPRLCYEALNKDAGMYALDGQLKMANEPMDCMQFYQNSNQFRFSLPRHMLTAELASKRPAEWQSFWEGGQCKSTAQTWKLDQ